MLPMSVECARIRHSIVARNRHSIVARIRLSTIAWIRHSTIARIPLSKNVARSAFTFCSVSKPGL